jgi:SAM-dependent methyltransferase
MGHRVVAADLDEHRVRLLSSGTTVIEVLSRLHCVVADADRTLPFDRAFDLALVVHFVSLPTLKCIGSVLRPGGYLIFESFGSQGSNWRQLPSPGQIANVLAREFEILQLRERLVGPTKSEAATVRLFARRRTL